MAANTNANDLLARKWFCEHCGTETEGKDPPNECDKCGHHLFENGLDVVSEGRPLPVPFIAAPPESRRVPQKHLGIPAYLTP